MTVRFGNQAPKPIRDPEYLPDAAHQDAFDKRVQTSNAFRRLLAVFDDHNFKRSCACEFCKIFKTEVWQR